MSLKKMEHQLFLEDTYKRVPSGFNLWSVSRTDFGGVWRDKICHMKTKSEAEMAKEIVKRMFSDETLCDLKLFYKTIEEAKKKFAKEFYDG